MSNDEVFVFSLSALIAMVSWGTYFKHEFQVRPYRYHAVARFPLLVAVAGSAALLYIVLSQWSSHDVMDSSLYTFFYFLIGAAWLGFGCDLLSYLNLSIRGDVLERSNFAASIACSGALIGWTACFAGGNVGDGPGWWVVIYSAMLSSVSAALAWIVLDWITDISDSITIDRDIGAGLRAAGFWLGAGITLGRAVAGNWVSYNDTNRDFIAEGWPVLCLLIVAVAMEFLTRPGRAFATAPLILRGVLPAAAYMAAALVDLFILGKP